MNLKPNCDLFDEYGNVCLNLNSMNNDDLIGRNKKLVESHKEEIKKLDLLYFTVGSYDELVEISRRKKEILIKSVTEIVSSLCEIHSIPLVIWLNGSYARNSNVYGSDIDINFCYSNRYYNIMLGVEEYISILLCEIFELKYRDLVHPMGYTPQVMHYSISHNLVRKLHISNQNSMMYHIRNSGLGIMEEFFQLSRDINDIQSYFINGFKNNPGQEWIYTKEIIYSNYLVDFFEVESSDISEETRKNIMENLREELREIIESINYYKFNTVADVKVGFRNQPLRLFYVFTIFSEKVKGSKLKCDISKCNISSNLKEKYVAYRKALMNYERKVNDGGIEWSIHNKNSNAEITSSLYMKLKQETLCFLNMLNTEVNRNAK